MSIMDNIRLRLLNWLMPDEIGRYGYRERLERYALLADYYAGHHRRQLIRRAGQPDDNISLNFTGLIVNRSVSMLLGNGIDFDLPGEDDDLNAAYINATWAANRKDILLHKVAQFGAIYGTCYIKIIPEALEYNGIHVARLVALDPLWWQIETEKEDLDSVIRYIGRYNVIGDDGAQIARKEIIERQMMDRQVIGWLINDYEATRSTGGQWVLVDSVQWPYKFPPIIHWQNLPAAGQIYGMSDIEDVIELQDRINFIASNISKIIRYHAHPYKYASGIANADAVSSWSPDEFKGFPAGAEVRSVEMQSDLSSSQQYLLVLRQALFDISRTVDISSMADRVGALTNFGLRVLFFDALAKLGTKRELYGEALSELNHRLLVMAGIEPADGGEVIWPDVLPIDQREEIEGLKFDLENGLASRESISEKRGYNYKYEQERMNSEQMQSDNVGAAILRAFNIGR